VSISHADYLLILQAAAAAFAVVRLLQFHLARPFPFLCSYLIVTALFSGSFSVMDEHSRAYVLTFIVADPVILFAAALAVFEMFALIFRDYAGLRTAGKWALNVALAVSIAVSFFVALYLPPRQGGTALSQWLVYEVVFDHFINFGLAVIVLILMWFLSRYPFDLDRNTYVASGFFSAMFLAQAADRLIDSISPHLFAHYADYPEVGFAAICFLIWGVMMRPASAPVRAAIRVNETREAVLLQQLASLNGILSRSVRG
jgi:hypothetical protein